MTASPSMAERADSPSPNPTIKTGLHSLAHLLLAALAAILSFCLFLLVRAGVKDKKHHVLAADHAILLFFHTHRSPFITVLAKGLAVLGSPPVMIAVGVLGCLIGLLDKRVRGAAWTLPVAIIGGGALIQGVKITFRRQRPDLFAPLLHETGYSFPSGHSLIAVVVYGLSGFFLMGRTRSRTLRGIIGALSVALIVLIGVSRVYVGVHYPTDVLAGWSLGIPWLIGCLALHEHLTRRNEEAGEPVFTNNADQRLPNSARSLSPNPGGAEDQASDSG